MTLDGADQSCLDDALTTIEVFYAGKAVTSEVEEAWSCAAGALALFKKHVQGGEIPGAYTANELRAFLHRYFLKEQKISDPLLAEVMRLKQAILGGSQETITREELDRADVILKTLQVESAKVSPYMRFLTLEADPSEVKDRPEFVEEGLAQLVKTSKVVGALLSRSEQPYRLADAERLLEEFGALYAETSGWRGPKKFSEYIPAFTALKAFFIRPNGDSIAPQEWPELVQTASRLYALFIRHKYQISDRYQTTGLGLHYLEILAKEFFDLMEDGVRNKTKKVIEFPEIDAFIEQIYVHEVFDFPMKVETAKQIARHLVQKAANPIVNGERADVRGVTFESIKWMRQDFFGWSEMQKAWDRMAADKPELTVEEVRERWKKLNLRHKDTAEEMDLLLSQPYPLVYTQTGTVLFQHPMEKLKFDQEGWTSLNWKRIFIRAAVRGYARDAVADRFDGMEKDRFKEFYLDLRDFAIELNFLDPRNTEIWDSTFDEANVFMLSADGNDRLSFTEGVEVLSFALSGSKMSRRFYKDVRENCENKELDVFRLPMVDVFCYRERFRRNYASYYELLPGWVETLNRISPEEWPNLQRTIEIAARIAGPKDVDMESADIDKTSMVLHYIESLFLRFDKDRSGTFSVKEAEAAFPLLRNILSDLSGFHDDETLLALFTYVIKYGETPDKNLWTGAKFLVWKHRKEKWDFNADRYEILKVVANLTGRPE